MAWVLNNEYRGKMNPGQIITRFADNIGNYTSIAMYFTARQNGTITFTAAPDVVYTYPKVFISNSTNFSFNTSTGEPDNYISTSTHSTSCEVIGGLTYVFCCKGYTSLPTPIEFNLSAQYTAYKYIAKLLPLINKAHGSIIFSQPSALNYTYIIPIKFIGSGKCYIYNSAYTLFEDGSKVTTTLESIDINTGLPSSDISEYYASIHGRLFQVTSNLLYYIYVRCDTSSLICQFYIDFGNTNNQGIHSNITAEIMDWAELTQGTYEVYPVLNKVTDATGVNNNNIYNELSITWVPRNLILSIPYDLTIYKRLKFIGWWTDKLKMLDYDMDYCISTSPSYQFSPDAENIKLYGLVEHIQSDFKWEFKDYYGSITEKTNILSNDPFRITSESWNDFLTYASYKIYKHGQSETFGHRGNNNPSCYTTPNDRLKASAYNRVKNALNSSESNKNPNDIIYASYFNDLYNKAINL